MFLEMNAKNLLGIVLSMKLKETTSRVLIWEITVEWILC